MDYKSEVTNPKLSIYILMGYIDWLIRQIDVFTEEALKKYSEADVFEIKAYEPF